MSGDRAWWLRRLQEFADAVDVPGALPADVGLADLARVVTDLHVQLPVPADSSCRRGCSACCHQPAPVSPAEALYLAGRLHAAGRAHALRMDRMPRRHRLAPVVDARTLWMRARRSCPALDADGACGIHDLRPLACREHHVRSDAELCSIPDAVGADLILPDVAWSWRLAEAGARLTGTAPLRIALHAVPRWVSRNSRVGLRRWPRQRALAVLRDVARAP